MKQFLSCRVKRLYLNAKNKLLGKKPRFPLLAWLGFSSKTTQGLRHGIRGGEFRKSKGCPSCQSKFKSYFGCLRGECCPETETMLRLSDPWCGNSSCGFFASWKVPCIAFITCGSWDESELNSVPFLFHHSELEALCKGKWMPPSPLHFS
ncbi:Uncharacterized protein TCM_041498 [Theobroma cacao]|uniref:Uncharacterized protein n=1 Tax=Theobroma cacao TaxID=3641 RepID=A0A061GVM1_THECC|nr:Uncharacterized protein TCM_041498 [Theobroma cacao]